MKQITVNVPDSKFEFIMKLFKELGINTENTVPEHEYEELTKEQKKAIKKAQEELKAGKGVDHTEAQKRIRKMIENKKSA